MTCKAGFTHYVQGMLETLRIENYALIDAVEVDFASGLNVLTGETGAGKSIVVGALNLVLGGRASIEVVRDGAARAKVDAVFRLRKRSPRLGALLKELEIETPEGELLLSRIVTADGRSRAYVSGSLVPIATLAQISDELVDIHGQHEHQSLLRPERQLDLLDTFAGVEALAGEVGEAVAELRRLDKAIAELAADDRERARRIEFLRFEVNEIDAAALASGEEEDLKSRRNIITNAEMIYGLASQAYGALYGEDTGAAVDTVDTALRALEELSRIDALFGPLTEQLTAARASIEAIASEIRGYTERVEYDPQELDSLNRRIALIGTLKRKYGDSVEAILAYRDKAADEIAGFEQRDERLAELEQQRKEGLARAQALAKAVSEKRRTAARKLDKQVTSALQDLGMKGGKLETQMEPTELSSHGIDRVEFLLAANPGERPRPLRQVASGGEISRIMLALKAVFADADRIPTLIFDEIDAGVGGAVATRVADKLRNLAKSHQTICITHLPQIAAAAHSHYNVAKATEKGRTTTRVTRVEDDSRVEEVARLLDGSLTELSLEHARALLKAR